MPIGKAGSRMTPLSSICTSGRIHSKGSSQYSPDSKSASSFYLTFITPNTVRSSHTNSVVIILNCTSWGYGSESTSDKHSLFIHQSIYLKNVQVSMSVVYFTIIMCSIFHNNSYQTIIQFIIDVELGWWCRWLDLKFIVTIIIIINLSPKHSS